MRRFKINIFCGGGDEHAAIGAGEILGAGDWTTGAGDWATGAGETRGAGTGPTGAGDWTTGAGDWATGAGDWATGAGDKDSNEDGYTSLFCIFAREKSQ